MNFTVEHARKVLEVVDAGLVSGVGSPIPGRMCVEAAICYALGLPHGDDPQCVAQSVRAFKIALNDKSWSSNEARASGLRALAVAQLGSKRMVDDTAFTRRLAELTIRIIVPLALRAAMQANPHQSQALEAVALRCERDGTSAAAYAASAYAASAASSAAAAAVYAASAAADAAASAVTSAAASAYAADAAASVVTQAITASHSYDEILTLSANLALQVLRELNAPGVALWDEVNAHEVNA